MSERIDIEKYREHFRGRDNLFFQLEKIVDVMNEPRRALHDMKNVAHFKAKERI